MEEYGSEGLEDFIRQEKSRFFADTDAVCISDNYWLGTKKPVLTYGLRGCSYYSVTIEGPHTDLHSGMFGGTVREPLTDLVHLLSTLHTQDHRIAIPGIQEMVSPLTAEESATYESIDYTLGDLSDSLGGRDLALHSSASETLQARWREPALSLHGVEGAFSARGAKTVIPAKVTGKFSIRTVPAIDLARLDRLVFDHLDYQFSLLKSKNSMSASLMHAGNWWVSDPSNWSFEAAKLATKAVWGVDPDLTREGGSIPVTNTFEEELGRPVLLLPMGRGDDGAHSTMEKLDRSNYVNGTKTLASYLYFCAQN